MWSNDKAVLNRKPNIERLLQYGFVETVGVGADTHMTAYTYATDILNHAFRLHIYVTEDNKTLLEVIDNETGEEYTLVGMPSAVGAFVGDVRLACAEVLEEIINSCYDWDIFKAEQTKGLIAYVRETYGAELEHLWEDAPNNAIFREPKKRKWYAAILTVEKGKLGIDEDGIVEIVDLKETPENIQSLVDHKNYFPGFHMNKKHWYTLCLDGRLPMEEVCRCVDRSYELVTKRK